MKPAFLAVKEESKLKLKKEKEKENNNHVDGMAQGNQAIQPVEHDKTVGHAKPLGSAHPAEGAFIPILRPWEGRQNRRQTDDILNPKTLVVEFSDPVIRWHTAPVGQEPFTPVYAVWMGQNEACHSQVENVTNEDACSNSAEAGSYTGHQEE